MNRLPRQLPLELTLPPAFNSEDLVVTNSNRPAYELVEQWPHWALPMALMMGPEGAGKSHFSMVWAEKAEAFIGQATALGFATEKAANGQSVLLEDVDSASLDETALFHLINTVRQSHTKNGTTSLLMTSRTAPGEWRLGLLDLASRMRNVMFVEINQPDDALLSAVLIKLFSDRQIEVDSQIINYVVSHVERSLASIQKLVEISDSMALEKKTKITKKILSEAMDTLNIG